MVESSQPPRDEERPIRLVRMIHLMCSKCGREWYAPIHHMCLDCNDPDIPVLFGGTVTEIVHVEPEEPSPIIQLTKPTLEDLLIRSVKKGREKPCHPLSQEELSDLHLQFPWW